MVAVVLVVLTIAGGPPLAGSDPAPPLLRADCAEVSPSRVEEAAASYRQGQELLDAGRWTEAEAPLRAAVGLDPRQALAFYGLGEAFMGLARFPEAVAAFTAAREAFRCTDGGTPEKRAAGDERREAQIRELREALRKMETDRLKAGPIQWREMNGSTPPTLAESRRMMDELEKRLHALQEWRRRGGAAPLEVSLALGTAEIQAGAVEDAAHELRAVAAADPRNGDAHNNLAVALMLKGELDEAEREVKLAERAGVAVNPRLRDEIRRRRAAPRP